MDIAASIQVVTEDILILLAKSLKKETGAKNLCMAGGVALNCVANGKLLRENIFENIWIQPAAGDAGNSLGAAYIAHYKYFNEKRNIEDNDSMKGAYLGPHFHNDFIIDYLKSINAKYLSKDDKELMPELAKQLDQGKVIGWFNGPMEFGPRSLGEDR